MLRGPTFALSPIASDGQMTRDQGQFLNGQMIQYFLSIG